MKKHYGEEDGYALSSYLIFEHNIETEHQADLILSGSLSSWGDDIESFAGRKEVISNKSLISVARLLYWDEENKRIKRGYSTKSRKGNIFEVDRRLEKPNETYNRLVFNGC